MSSLALVRVYHFFVLLQMLPVWLTDKGLSVELIGALTGVMVPYGLKFLWAPLLDRYFPHFLGRRRSWLLISQVVLLISLYAISQFDPVAELSMVAKIATFYCLFLCDTRYCTRCLSS